MALPPRLIPFPWEEVFITVDHNLPFNQRYANVEAFVRNPDNLGATLVVNISDSEWESFAPGLADTAAFDVDICWPTKRWITYHPSGIQDWEVSTWDTYTDLSTVPALNAANRTDIQWYHHWQTGVLVGATPRTGRMEFPGALGTLGNNGYGYCEVIWKNRPIWYEQWFEENTLRPNPLWGFLGYTVFTDQVNCEPRSFNSADVPADIWRRRFLFGLVKRSANIATCGPEDIMLGVLITSDGVTSTMRMCCNGAVLHTSSRPTVYGKIPSDFPADSWAFGWPSWDSAWGGRPSEVEVWPQLVDEMVGAIDPDVGWYSMSQWTPNDAFDIPISGVDTYDVKYAWYIDDTSATHPVDTATGPMKHGYVAQPPSMSALHGELLPPPPSDFWTQTVDATESGGRVTPYVPMGQFLTNALALNPVLHVDFEAEVMPPEGTPYTPPVNTIGATSEWNTGDDPNFVIIEGPVGKAGYDSAGGWWGITSALPSASVFDSLAFDSGFTIVKVLKHSSETGGYAEAWLDCWVGSHGIIPESWGLNAIYLDVLNYDSSLPSEATVRMSVSCARIGYSNLPESYEEILPVPFMETDSWNVYALSVDPSVPGEMRLVAYVNGTVLMDHTFTLPSPLNHSYGPSAVPHFDSYSDSGGVDEYLLYDRVLTPAEIATLTL